jgi:hypothetical protein
MTPRPIWLVGTIAHHARGKVLAEATGAAAVESLPEQYGLCLAFGTDFQDQSAAALETWTQWVEPAGRTLMLVPPFRLVESAVPAAWRVYRPQRVDPAGGEPLAKLLASEVRHELSGTLQVAVEVDGQWKSGGLHTAYYRTHPHSGVFAITCLPLWSLTVLDHREAVRKWLDVMGGLAGEPAPVADADREVRAFRLGRDHFALMLHLCERDFESRDEALARLPNSPVLALPEGVARMHLEELESVGLVMNGRLTDAGEATLVASPYGVYAAALRRNRP